MRKYISALLMIFASIISCHAATVDSVSHQISIMTYNIKMLPRGANSFLHHFPLKRASLIPAELLAENPDVIVFQEAFDGVAVRIIKRKLKAAYPYNMGFKNRKVITYKRAGGVLMFSKYPMTELESIRYTQCKGIDCIAHKGALLVEVAHPAGRFQLFGTHMQAGGSNELKLSQYEQAGALIRRHEQRGIPQFMAGDFNTRKSNAVLYEPLRKALDAEDGDITGDLQFTSDHMLNDMENYDEKRRHIIDFIFYRSNGVRPISSVRYIRQFRKRWDMKHQDLSDHNALILKMQL